MEILEVIVVAAAAPVIGTLFYGSYQFTREIDTDRKPSGRNDPASAG